MKYLFIISLYPFPVLTALSFPRDKFPNVISFQRFLLKVHTIQLFLYKLFCTYTFFVYNKMLQ